MLKNIDPIMSAPLLSAVSRVNPGHWIAITSAAPNRRGVATHATVDRLASALFPLVELSTATPTPLVGWLADASDEDSLDAFFAVQGTARDAERRALEMGRLESLPDHVWDNVDEVFTVDSPVDFAFFVCLGGAAHEPVELLRERVMQAA